MQIVHIYYSSSLLNLIDIYEFFLFNVLHFDNKCIRFILLSFINYQAADLYLVVNNKYFFYQNLSQIFIWEFVNILIVWFQNSELIWLTFKQKAEFLGKAEFPA